MARIGLNIYVAGYSGQLLIVWKEVVAGNPTPPETGRSAAQAFPYSAVYTINDISPVAHLVELWRSSDGVALDELIKRWEIDASIYNEISHQTYQYKVGRGTTEGTIGNGDYWIDPSNGDTQLVDERIDGATQDELIVHEAGFGHKLNAEYDLLAGGGIELLNGYTFNQDTAWFITWSRVVAQQVQVTTAATYTGIEEVTASRDVYVDATDNLYNKLVIINGAGSNVTLTFPDVALIPNNTKMTVNTHRGSQKYCTLQFDAGDTVYFNGQAVNVIYLAKCEEISMYWKSGVCYVTSYNGRALRRGSVFASMDSSLATDTGAYLLADESTGELAKADYPGLYAWIAALPASHSVALGVGAGQWSYSLTVNTGKINEATTYPYKSKFGIDTGAETFRVPHLKNLGRRFLDTGEFPGRYQHDAVGKFEAVLTVPKGYSYTGAPNNNRFGNGATNPQDTATANSEIETGNTESIMKNFGETPFIVL